MALFQCSALIWEETMVGTRGNLSARSKGIGFIEVLASMLIVAIAIVALTRATTASLNALNSSQMLTTVSTLVNDLAERIRANPVGASCFADQVNNVSGACVELTVDDEGDFPNWQTINAYNAQARVDFANWEALRDTLEGRVPNLQVTATLIPSPSISDRAEIVIFASWSSGGEERGVAATGGDRAAGNEFSDDYSVSVFVDYGLSGLSPTGGGTGP